MTKLLEKAVGEILSLSESRQDEIAAIILRIAEDNRMMDEWGLTREQVDEVRHALTEEDVLTPEETKAFFARFQ